MKKEVTCGLIKVEWNGYEYRVVLGHVPGDGYFIAIVNWNVCILISEPSDIRYNRVKIGKALENDEAGTAIAEKIKDEWGK